MDCVIAFTVGLFFGASFGVFLLALAVAASDRDGFKEEEKK